MSAAFWYSPGSIRGIEGERRAPSEHAGSSRAGPGGEKFRRKLFERLDYSPYVTKSRKGHLKQLLKSDAESSRHERRNSATIVSNCYTYPMNNFFIKLLALMIVIVGGFYFFNSYIYNEKQAPVATDYKNATYMIEGQPVKLVNGVAESEAAPGSASKIVTRYFGNELKTDLDGDGREDVAFILTQEGGGSGVFFYGVGALNTDKGYVGTEGYLLGDRVAPQNTSLSPNPRHKQVVVFNYADRAEGEPMTTRPSIGKSIYLKLDPQSMRWAIVEPNFEGESR